MSDAIHLLVPLFAFMLIPVWIPIIGSAAGLVCDLFRPRAEHPALVAVRARQEALTT